MDVRDKVRYFYSFVEKLNNKANDLIPLDDDIDKKIDILKFIKTNINLSDDELFLKLKEYVLDLEVVGDDIHKYTMHNDKIVKVLSF